MSTFQPARRENIPLLIAVEGPSGSGKTKSGLEVLAGIGDAVAARTGRAARLGVIDTDNRRALHYADDYQFMHLDMKPPFSPLAFGDLIDDAEKADIDALMIDTFSHEWAGEGGVKEWAARLEAGVPKAGIANPESWKRDNWITQPVKSPGNWSDPKSAVKPGHKWLVAKMLRAPMHIVLCLRSEEKMLMRQVPKLDREGQPEFYNGKPKMVSEVIPAADRPLLERWVPQCEKDLPYEITTSLLFLPDAPGVPHVRKVQDQHLPLIQLDRRVDRAVGRALAEWADGAKTVDPRLAAARAATLLSLYEEALREQGVLPLEQTRTTGPAPRRSVEDIARDLHDESAPEMPEKVREASQRLHDLARESGGTITLSTGDGDHIATWGDQS